MKITTDASNRAFGASNPVMREKTDDAQHFPAP
jgi:hypothetical protein